MMFSRYPNTNRAAPEYLAELINCLADQPAWIVDRVADRRIGITAKHPTFLPSVNEVLEMIKALEEAADREAAYLERKTTMTAIPLGAYRGNREARFKPFPKLWAAFAEDPEALDRLNSGLTFNTLFDASKALATIGFAAARHIIMRPAGPKALDADTLSKIEMGTWSSADLKTPAAPASAELKAMMLGEDK